MYGSVNKFSYLEVRLYIAIIASVIIMVADGKLNMFFSLKNYIGHSVYLFCRLCNQPITIYDSVSNFFIGYKNLIAENNRLHQELFIKKSELLLINHYKQENDKLYELLNSPICKSNRKLIAKVFFVNIDSYYQKAMINQGFYSNVYVGQPIISDSGVVGQVISVNKNNSQILLISDRTHALPVKLQRNNVCMILMGRGYNSDLYVEYPGNIDIYIDDILVTSGLDGQFPEGYPVATVSKIQINSDKDCTIIQARPIVKLKKLRYSILIWE